jgi:hypothetical protein
METIVRSSTATNEAQHSSTNANVFLPELPPPSDTMLSWSWTRMKICAAEDCLWAYCDHSKSRTGRWCAMETCGNRHKTRRYRRKKRTSARQRG